MEGSMNDVEEKTREQNGANPSELCVSAVIDAVCLYESGCGPKKVLVCPTCNAMQCSAKI